MADETRTGGPPNTLLTGAAEGAPTAPHATPRAGGDPGPGTRTGPERFWNRRRAKRAFASAVLGSMLVHWLLGPWSILPQTQLDIRDRDGGVLSIDVELLSEEAPRADPTVTATQPPPEDPAAGGKGAGGGGRDGGSEDASADGSADASRDAAREAGPRKKKDAGVAHDAGDEDAGDDGGSGIDDAGDDGGAGAIAVADAGAHGPGTTRDPRTLLGKAGEVQAGPPNVKLVLNMAEVRKNPVGASIGPLVTAAPQWRDFLAGSKVDPVQHTDWLYLVGPSLAHTERDAVIVRYAIDDVWVDAAIDRISKRAPDGRTVDAGVPGVKVTLGFGDHAKRAFVRPQPHLVAVVPPDYAATAARILRGKISPRLVPNEAVYFQAHDPHGSVAQVPEEIKDLRIRVVHAADEGVEVLAEGDCDGAEACARAAAELKDFLRRANSLGVRLVTRGVLNNADVRSESALVKLRIPIARDQLDALFALAAGALGVNAAPPPPSGSASVPPTPP